MDLEKALTRVTVGASIAGLLIVIYAVSTDSIPATSKGYTEVYFENLSMLPRVMVIGDKYIIPFIVSSNEREAAAYNYTAAFNGIEIARGSFTLAPGEKKRLTLEVIPETSSWRLSSNKSSRVVDRFSMGEVLIKEDREGGINAYPAKFNESELGEKGLLLLPLNKAGSYSAESEYNNGSRGRARSIMRITRDEIYMEHSSQAREYNFTWSNLLKLPDFVAEPLPFVWLAVNKTESKLKSGSVAYGNVSLDFDSGLPGEIYLLPMEGRHFISYSSKKAFADRIEYVEKNATIAVDREGISIEKVLREETYALGKVKLGILLSSDAGKSYEIHFWSYVRD
jgi:hypothetical protein